MNWIKTYILVGCILCGVNLAAQKKTISKEKKVEEKDSIKKLKEIFLTTAKSAEQKVKGQKKISLGVEEVIRNPTNFTETLRFNSPIAFRDYGNGGVSTASFRGTSATNTTVLWNGISINAIGNGQTDFNALSVQTTDEIEIVSGGSSALYGSGAIGGAILLKNKVDFKKETSTQLFTSYGSFNTSSNFLKFKRSNNKWSLNIGLSYNRSDNDYEYLDTRFRDEDDNLLVNENAAYDNYSVDANLGYRLNNKNKLYFYSSLYEGDRLFSAGIPNPSSGSERNQDFSVRNLLKWESSFNKFSQLIKIAYLEQVYRYSNDRIGKGQINFGKSITKYFEYNLNYDFSKKVAFNSKLTYENIIGFTDLIAKRTRKIASANGFLNYRPIENLLIATTIRVENNSDFDVPVAASLAFEQQVNNWFALKANISNNYRVPTYNELFWPTLGNKNLVPETTKQIDIGGILKTDLFELSGTYYYYDIKDKIIWLPVSAISIEDLQEIPLIVNSINPWRPFNIDNVIHNGVELNIKFNYQLNKNHAVKWVNNYTFSNTKNTKTNKRLPYVPLHLFNFNLDYTYQNKYNLYLQGIYQSEVFITADIIKERVLEGFTIFNLGANITLFSKESQKLILGGKVNNVFNSLYYFVNYRPNPGRNLAININYKF